MAKSKDDIKYGSAQARQSEDEALRLAYKHGTPLEAGKIADSKPVDLFSTAHNIQKSSDNHDQNQDQDQDQDQNDCTTTQSQLHRDPTKGAEESGSVPNTGPGSAKFPSKKPPSLATK